MLGHVGIGASGTPRSKVQGRRECGAGSDPGCAGAVWTDPPPTGAGQGSHS